MKTAVWSCLVVLGSLIGVAACDSVDEGSTQATAGTGGSATAGAAGTSSTGGSGAGTTATGGSVTTGGGGASAGSGGMAASGAGVGGAAAGNGGAGGSAGAAAGSGGGGGAAGGAACDGKTGKALSFKNDKIDLVAGDLGPDLVGGNTARTVELWAHFLGDKSWVAEHTVIELGRKKDAANQVFGIDMAGRNADNGVFDPYTNGVGDNDPTAVMLAVEGWHHLSWAFDGAGHFQFVVDGIKIAIAHDGGGTAALATTQGILTLGGSQSFGTQGWEGVMDEVRVWSTFRSVDEIKNNMKVKLKGTETGLVAYYNLDEGTGTTADDIAKKGGHKLSFCTNNGGPCPAANDAAPTWVDSDIPGPFSCAP